MSAIGTFSREPWTRQAIMREFRRAFVDECNIVDYTFSPKKNCEGDTVVYLALDTPASGVTCYVAEYFIRGDELVYRMTPESWCPSVAECPQKILALLSPTDDATAQKWREQCRNNLLRRDKYGNTEIRHNVYVADSDLTPAEVDAYAEKIRKALTEGGNICCVDVQDNLISIDGNKGGNMRQFLELVDELYTRGCFLEADMIVDEYGNCEQYEDTISLD